MAIPAKMLKTEDLACNILCSTFYQLFLAVHNVYSCFPKLPYFILMCT